MQRAIFKLSALILACTTLYLLDPVRLTSEIGLIDFKAYYSATEIFVSGRNPYDFASLKSAESLHRDGQFIPIWNPPILFPILSLWTLVNFEGMRCLWLLVSSAIFLFSIARSLNIIDKIGLRFSKKFTLLTLVAVGSFYPFISNIYYGQISPLLLLGFCGILYELYSSDMRPWRIGLYLALTSVKPQILFLLYLRFILNGLFGRDFRIIFFWVLGLFALALVATCVNPEIWTQYKSITDAPPIFMKTTTIGSLLQGLSNVHTTWMRLLPTILASVAATYYFLRNPKILKNIEIIFAIVPISLALSPYGWIYDQMLVLPSVLYLIQYQGSHKRIIHSLVIIMNIGMCVHISGIGMETYWWYSLLLGGICAWVWKMQNSTLSHKLKEEVLVRN